MTGDGLPDIAAYDDEAVHVLVNERNDISHPTVVSRLQRDVRISLRDA